MKNTRLARSPKHSCESAPLPARFLGAPCVGMTSDLRENPSEGFSSYTRSDVQLGFILGRMCSADH